MIKSTYIRNTAAMAGFVQYECGTKAAEALLLHLKKNIKIQETKK